MNEQESPNDDAYAPDPRLKNAYREANHLDGDGLESLCPSYSELAQKEPRYQNETVIGKGALKIVSRAYDRQTKRWVAMARLRPGRDEEYFDHFVHEAWLVASLSHPNIIKVHDTGISEDGRPFFTMDLKGKSTLTDLVKSKSEKTLRELLQVFVKVCDAIAYAHSKKVVHLDLKPDNIQSDAFGEVMVCDWGLGKILEDATNPEEIDTFEEEIYDNMTLLGQVKGSLGFMAPEQAAPDRTKGSFTDIYALGCILHFILTGEPPFKGSRDHVLQETANTQITSIRLSYPEKEIPESLDAVVVKAMSLDPKDRYASVPRLQREIERYLSGYATRAERPGFFREARLFVSRNRLPTAISAAAFLVLGIVSTIYGQHLARQKTATALERNRANQLLEEVENLDTEYNVYIEESNAAKKQLAQAMSKTARQVRDLSIFERPLAAVKSSRNMATMALDQDPQCIEAHTQHFALDCLQLNYKSALTRPTNPNEKEAYNDFIQFAERFPEYNYTEDKRPTIEELVYYINTVRELNSQHDGHLERVLAYDNAARKNNKDYSKVLEAFLQYRYGGPENLTLSFDNDNSTLKLWSNQDISLLGQEYHWKSLLRFLTFRFLKLEIKGRFQLEDLNGQPIESLDLSQCDDIHLDKSITLPQLRKILLNAEQLENNQYRLLITSHEFFEIVEAPPTI